MNYNTLKEKVCCPFDHSDLHLQILTIEEATQNILEGILDCPQCKRIYPIISGIPIMVPDEYRESSLEQPIIKKWEKIIGTRKIQDFKLIDE